MMGFEMGVGVLQTDNCFQLNRVGGEEVMIVNGNYNSRYKGPTGTSK